jgi:hypothetical protein
MLDSNRQSPEGGQHRNDGAASSLQIKGPLWGSLRTPPAVRLRAARRSAPCPPTAKESYEPAHWRLLQFAQSPFSLTPLLFHAQFLLLCLAKSNLDEPQFSFKCA